MCARVCECEWVCLRARARVKYLVEVEALRLDSIYSTQDVTNLCCKVCVTGCAHVSVMLAHDH
jgi:hypothetical protein